MSRAAQARSTFETSNHLINAGDAAVTFLHLLLPVWMGAYRFQAKVYQVLVNAQTGEVQGERPYSSVKIAPLAAAILLVAVVLWLVAQR
jgi:hypothetical protein